MNHVLLQRLRSTKRVHYSEYEAGDRSSDSDPGSMAPLQKKPQKTKQTAPPGPQKKKQKRYSWTSKSTNTPITKAFTQNGKGSVSLGDFVAFTPDSECEKKDQEAGYFLKHNIGRVLQIRDASEDPALYSFEIEMEHWFSRAKEWTHTGWHVWKEVRTNRVVRSWIPVDSLVVNSYGGIFKMQLEANKKKKASKRVQSGMFNKESIAEFMEILSLYDADGEKAAPSSEFTDNH